jgi:hypothetical protein
MSTPYGTTNPFLDSMIGDNQKSNKDVISQLDAQSNPLGWNDYAYSTNSKGIIGTSNPYQSLVPSDIIINPSTVSVSEFQKMAYSQPVIFAALTLLLNLVQNRIGRYQHHQNKYTDFINNMFSNMNTPLPNVIKEIFTGCWAGFYVGEKVYDTVGRNIVVKDVLPRPPSSVLFRVNPDGSLKDDGIVQYYFNSFYGGNANILSFNGPQNGIGRRNVPNPYASRGDMDYPYRTMWAQPIGAIIIPTKKCIHYAHKGLDGFRSPYGRSLLRSVYGLYLLKCQLDVQMGVSSKLRACDIPIFLFKGNQVNTKDGKSMADNLQTQLSKLGTFGSNGQNYLLLQGVNKDSVQIEYIKSTANLEDLTVVGLYYTQQILTALGFPAEIAGMSNKGSYALGKSQSDLLGRNIVSEVTKDIQEVLMEQLIKPILKENFGDMDDYGGFVENDDTSQDLALNIDIINSANAHLAPHGLTINPDYMLELLSLDPNGLEKMPKSMQGQNLDKNGAVVAPKSYGTTATLTKSEGWDNK